MWWYHWCFLIIFPSRGCVHVENTCQCCFSVFSILKMCFRSYFLPPVFLCHLPVRNMNFTPPPLHTSLSSYYLKSSLLPLWKEKAYHQKHVFTYSAIQLHARSNIELRSCSTTFWLHIRKHGIPRLLLLILPQCHRRPPRSKAYRCI